MAVTAFRIAIGTWRLIAALVAACVLAGLAGADTFGAWTLAPPKNAAVSGPVDGDYEIRDGDGATYRLTAPLSADDTTPRGLLDQLSGAMSKLNPAFEPDVAITQPDGTNVLLRMGTVEDPGAGKTVVAFAVYTRGDQRGLFTATVYDPGALDRLATALETARFSPGNATSPVRTATAPSATAPANGTRPSVAGVWPKGGRIAASRAGVSVPQAVAMGLDPHKMLVPDTFDCYLEAGEEVADPAPAGRVTFNRNGTYQWTGPGAGVGNWSQAPASQSRPPITLTGPLQGLTGDGSYVNLDHHGQNTIVRTTSPNRQYSCYQQGPSAENQRLTIARQIIAPGPMRCSLAAGGTLDVTFTERGYTSALGNGTFDVGVDGAQSNALVRNWFTGGPFDQARGDYSEDEEGFRTLDLAIHITERRAFYVGSRTEPVAVCTGKSAARPEAFFGPAAAPKASGTGGFEGLYSTLVSIVGVNGLDLDITVYRFQKDGWFAELDGALGAAADCTRTLPNGAPMCRRYEVSGNRIRLQAEDEAGPGQWVTYVTTGNGFEADDVSYERVAPMTGLKLNATYAFNRAVSFGGVAEGAGQVLQWQKQYVFTSAGRFDYSGSSQSNTYLSGGFGGGGAIGGGGASRGTSVSGTYAVAGNTITLKFDDGRTERQLIHNYSDGWKPGSGAPQYLSINGEQFEVQS